MGGIIMATYFKIIDKNRTDGFVNIVRAPFGSQVLFAEIEDIVGMKPCPANDIPYALEVDGWGELACEGEIYETEDFVVVALPYEDYRDYID